MEDQVIIFDKDTRNFAESLGVSDERVDELDSQMKQFHRSEGTITEVLKRISEVAETLNEFALMSCSYGFHLGREAAPYKSLMKD